MAWRNAVGLGHRQQAASSSGPPLGADCPQTPVFCPSGRAVRPQDLASQGSSGLPSGRPQLRSRPCGAKACYLVAPSASYVRWPASAAFPSQEEEWRRSLQFLLPGRRKRPIGRSTSAEGWPSANCSGGLHPPKNPPLGGRPPKPPNLSGMSKLRGLHPPNPPQHAS